MSHGAENGLPEFGGSLGTSVPVDSPKPRAECDNYRPPLTCLTAPSTETGRCDKCQARVLPPAEGCTCGRDTYDGPGKQWLSHAPNCRVLPPGVDQ